jgi:hypothetical protein
MGGAIAFEGATSDAALFCARMTTEGTQAIVRVDAEGRATHIADVTKPEDQPVAPVLEIAWDATRRTLWGACGEAGLLCVTAPGAPVPGGVEGAAS